MFGMSEGGVFGLLGRQDIWVTVWGTCLLTSGAIFFWSLFFSVWDLYIFFMYGCITYFYRPVWELFGRDDFMITVFGTFIIGTTVILGWCLFFSFVDIYQKPKWMLKYKVQQGTNAPVDRAKLLNTYKVALLNLTVLNLSVAIVIYPIQQYFGCTADPDKLPPLWVVIRDVAIIILVGDIGFYYAHRLLHWPPLYKYHKQHHEWTAPTGITAFYNHPLDYILSFNLRFELGPILCGSHVCTMWFRAVWLFTVAIVHHSGYHLPFFHSPEFHDYHHKYFNVNYGAMRFLDRWHGTDYEFLNTVEEKRHVAFFSTTKSIRDIIPDPVNKKEKVK